MNVLILRISRRNIQSNTDKGIAGLGMVATRSKVRELQMMTKRARRLAKRLIHHKFLPDGVGALWTYDELRRYNSRPIRIDFCEQIDGVPVRSKLLFTVCLHAVDAHCNYCSSDPNLNCRIGINKFRRLAYLCCLIWNLDPWVNK